MEQKLKIEDLISGKSLSFDTGIALHCGVNAAIVFNHICYWLTLNEENPDCQIDDKIWMYESQKKMANFFKFFSEKEVRDYIKILLDKGLLVKKKMCDNPFNQTNWYSLSDKYFQKVFSKRQNCRIDTDLAVSSEQTNSSHVYKEKDIKKDIKNSSSTPTPQNYEIVKTPSNAAAAADKIFFMNQKGERDFAFKKDAYKWALNYPTELIEEAFLRIEKEQPLIGNFKKFFLAICDRLLAEYQKNVNQNYNVEERRKKIEDEAEEYKRKLEEHKNKPKGRFLKGKNGELESGIMYPDGSCFKEENGKLIPITIFKDGSWEYKQAE